MQTRSGRMSKVETSVCLPHYYCDVNKVRKGIKQSDDQRGLSGLFADYNTDITDKELF